MLTTVHVPQVGVLFLALIVGSATTVLADLQKQRTEISNQLQSIARYMKHTHLPRPAIYYPMLRYLSLQVHEEQAAARAAAEEDPLLLQVPA